MLATSNCSADFTSYTTFSNSVAVTYNTAPSITGQPSNAVVCSPNNASFTVTATGSGLSYQWQYFDGVSWINTGSNSATLSVPNGDPNYVNGRQFRVIVSGSCTPSVTSNTVTLTINLPTAISTQPSGTSVCAPSGAGFTVVATGSGLTYQWQEDCGSGYGNVSNGGVYSGATSNSLSISNVTGLGGCNYRVNVSGACGNVTSTAALLTVPAPVAISSQPSDVTVCAPTGTSFSVGATGAGLSYQWQVNIGSGFNNVSNGGIYSGATSATLNLAGTVPTMSGYQYRVLVTGTCGSATSNAATLTVNSGPVITTQPSNTSVCNASPASFSVTATGAGLTYQWQQDCGSGFSNIVNGGVYSGATSNNLSISSSTGLDGCQYRAVVTGSCGSPVNSNAATLSITPLPTITSQPVDAGVCVGTNQSFSVTATGATGYQWQYFNGVIWVNLSDGPLYSGTSTATMTVLSPGLPLNGTLFRCAVSGSCGSVNSASGLLTVVAIPGTPSVISGPNPVCNGAGVVTYTTPAILPAPTNYIWNLPSGAVIVSGNNTNTIQVDFSGVTPGTYVGGITVSTQNVVGVTTCNSVASAAFSITVVDQATITSALWTGATNDNWHVANNWVGTPGAVACLPTCGTNVTIDLSANNPVIYTSNTANARSVNVQDGGLTIQDNATLEVCGNLSVTAGVPFSADPLSLTRFVGITPTQSINHGDGDFSGSRSFGRVEIQKPSGQMQASAALSTITVTDLLVTQGTCNLNGKDITIRRDLNVASGTTLSNWGNNVTFNDSYNGTFSILGTAADLPNVLFSKTGGNLTLSTDMNIRNTSSLTFTGGANGRIVTGANKVIVKNGAVGAVSGHTASAYVAGTLDRVIGATGNYQYPVGDITNLQLLAANWTAVPTYSSVEVSFTNTPLGAPSPMKEFCNGGPDLGLPYSSFLNHGYWSMNGMGAGTAGTYDLNLYPVAYSNYAGGAVTIMSRDGGPWQLLGNCDISSTASLVKRNGLTSFSDKGAAQGQTPFPVELLQFTATPLESAIRLDWTTSQETNNQGFEVERGIDATTFSKIGWVEGNGTISTPSSYTLTDEAVAFNTVYYYRLKQVDYDGAYRYSNVVEAVLLSDDALSMAIFPNPTEGMLYVKYNAKEAEAVKMTVFDVLGKSMAVFNEDLTAGVGQIELDLTSLAAGTYTIQLTTPSGMARSFKFIKSK